MAGNRIVGITIDIEGKSDKLVSSLKTANSAINSTSQALKDVDKALKLDPTNVELLTQKEELLNKQIEQTNEKLEIMEQVANDANDALARGDISQEQYAQLTAEISMTESALGNLQSEAENTNATLEAIDSGEMDELADGADDAADSLGDVEEESGNAGMALDALGGIAAAAGIAMATATAAMLDGLKEVASALIDCTTNGAAYADEIMTMSSVTGLSTDKLQELGYAAELVDTSVETITSSMKKNLKAMDSAREGTGAAAEAYAALGISVTDAEGNLRDQETVYWEVIDALGQIENETERNALAMDLLGKSAMDLNPLIEAGSETMAELAKEAHETGYVLDEETLGAYGDLDDQLQRLNNGATAAKNALGTILLPTLTSLAGTGTTALNKFTKAVQDSDGDIGKIGDAISEMLPEIFDEVNKVLPDILNLLATALDTMLQMLIDNLPLIVDSALQIVTMLADTLINPENITKIIDAAVTIILTLVQYLIENLPTIIDAAVQIILAVVNGLTQALPQLIPAVVDAILTICDTLLAGDQLKMILDAALQLIIALAGGLVDALPQIIERLPEIINGIVGFLTGDALPDIIDAGITLITAIVTDLPVIIEAIVEALVDLVASMVEFITGDGAADMMGGFLEAFWAIIDAASDWGADIIANLVDGITSGLSGLWDTLGDVAEGIKDFLGFSVPEKGPLHEWAYNNPGADMVDLFAEGIDEELPELQSSIDLMAGTIAGSSSPNYSGTLNEISAGVQALGSGGGQIIIPVYIGDERIDTVVAQAQARNLYLTGGR